MNEKPNLKFPLAASYNTRGVDAFTNIFTNALDQRKINSVYEPVRNALTEGTTLYLAKRPGTSSHANTWGNANQSAYLWEVAPGAADNNDSNLWLFSVSSNAIRASTPTTTHTVTTSAGYYPAWVDKTAVSGVETLLLQNRNASMQQKVFHTTSIGGFTEINDSVFTGMGVRGKIEPMDGYVFALSSTNRIHNSALNTVHIYPASGYIAKQIRQDLPMALARHGKQILAFGLRTMEVFRNAGNADGSPLQSVPQLFQNIGMANIEIDGVTSYYAHDNLGRMFFVGAPTGAYVYNGSAIEKVSTPAIDKVLSGRTVSHVGLTASGGRSAIAFLLDHATSSTQRWLMYFPEWKDWFEWNSTVIRPVNSYRVTTTYLGVGANSHRLFLPVDGSYNTDWYRDENTDYTWTHQFKLPSPGGRQFMTWCGVIGDTARNTTTSTLTVEFSDDDGQTWTTPREIDMVQMRKIITRCGSFYDRLVRLSHTANLDVRLEKFIARVE